ncbi:ABC transporter permease [Roseimaritima ulvae]|uniref:Binding-protein-dependent transport system inner membrane component n=2 Tax=Roseimaritima ulvae TaxID=980254 RepID=A0A5B9QTJ0_9BACT|nr:ABC transporter permease subunit [Roseimaritima ulvae]QEG42334.1 Binding-protein-dependent transport system inner membrane component [Roseimaritima ulvae]
MPSLLLTVVLIGLSVLIATPLGVAVAVSLAIGSGWTAGRWIRTAGIGLLLVLICLPMYVHAAAWEATAGKYGWLPLMQTSANRFWFSGLLAAAWIHGVSGAAWVALATLWGLTRVPAALLQQAALETGPWSRLGRIAVPYAAPATLAGALWVALLAATEMTVADLYGVRTLADEVYLKYAFEPQTLPIVLACLLPLLVATPLVWLMQRMLGPARRSAASPHASGSDVWAALDLDASSASPLRWLASLPATGLLLLMITVPLVSLFVKAGLLVEAAGQYGSGPRYRWSWQRVADTLSDSLATFAPEFVWTAVLAVTVAAVAMLLGTLSAAWAQGSERRARWGFFTAMALVLLPGPVVGMGVLYLFHDRGPLLAALYERSIVPTVVALLPRAVPAAYLVMRAGYRMLPPEPGEAARCDGARPWQCLLRIDLPRLKTSLLVAGFAAGIVATADVPATLVVLPPGMTTVGTRLFGLLHSGVRYQAAGLTISFCLLVGLLVILTHAWCGRRRAVGVR